MVLRRRKKNNGSNGYHAVVTLIRTKVNPTSSIRSMQKNGLDSPLALRYLDLAIVVAAREVLGQMSGAVVLPDEYNPAVEIPGQSAQFDTCQITAELIEVYRAEPTAATLLAPMSSDYVAINLALKKTPDDLLGLPAPTVGDGSQLGFARETFGVESVQKFAESWPDLA